MTMGPRVPELDGSMRPLRRPMDVTGFEIEPLDDIAQADALVARRIDELQPADVARGPARRARHGARGRVRARRAWSS